MAGNKPSSFDDLLKAGEREFDELLGRASGDIVQTNRPAPVQPVRPEPSASSEVIKGTAGGVPFRLKTR
jgi:hypothetical protein